MLERNLSNDGFINLKMFKERKLIFCIKKYQRNYFIEPQIPFFFTKYQRIFFLAIWFFFFFNIKQGLHLLRQISQFIPIFMVGNADQINMQALIVLYSRTGIWLQHLR